ncbi:acid phosphatase-domain-containing protein [Lipomyces oligophaga]|uniref:acid phosphatase-domain-containing protein n=1 Tax=Lipomyces oligophaga TaxID=45792 RepID=UPI0034CE44DE
MKDDFLDGDLPKIVVFDLDYTLWPACISCWSDVNVSPPVRAGKTRDHVVDRSGEKIGFFKDVARVISALKARGVLVGAASRTDAISTAKSMLRLIEIDNKPAMDHFDAVQIYPGSKLTHFSRIRTDTEIPYHEMLFFDDESRNKEVEYELGVKFMFVQDGVTWDLFRRGIEEWRVHRQEYQSGAKKPRKLQRLKGFGNGYGDMMSFE